MFILGTIAPNTSNRYERNYYEYFYVEILYDKVI